jgi:uridine kinase
MSVREALLARIATMIVHLDADRPIIAVDGIDGAGKTSFANELAPHIAAQGRSVIRASVDGFHNPRSVRYRRGKDDPQGFFLDSYDYSSLKQHLLQPFRTGAAEAQTARFDHKTDKEVATATVRPDPRAVLLIDGIFLHRDELRGLGI